MVVQDVDFLPATYRQTRLKRRQSIWRRSSLVVFLGLIAAGGLGQIEIRRQLVKNRDALRADADRIRSQLESPEELKTRIHRLQVEADLLTYLRIRVPPTRLLTSVARALPRYVTLSEFELRYEMPPLVAPTGPPTDPNAQKASKLPREKDLEELKKLNAGTKLCVNVSGTAPDDNAIAQFLKSLEKTGVFSEVTLLFTDLLVVDESNLRRFGVRLLVKPPPYTTEPPAPEKTALKLDGRTSFLVGQPIEFTLQHGSRS